MSDQLESIIEHVHSGTSIESVDPTEVQDITTYADMLVVDDQASYDQAARFLSDVVKPGRAKVANLMGPVVSAAHKAHKQAVAKRNELDGPLEKAEKTIKRTMGDWVKVQREVQLQQQRELEQAVNRATEEQAALEISESLERGDEEGAEAIANQLARSTGVELPVNVASPKSESASVRTVVRWRVVDHESMSRHYMIPDSALITRCVKLRGKGAEALVGGIEVYEDVVIASR